jgi:hypothetical protein
MEAARDCPITPREWNLPRTPSDVPLPTLRLTESPAAVPDVDRPIPPGVITTERVQIRVLTYSARSILHSSSSEISNPIQSTTCVGPANMSTPHWRNISPTAPPIDSSASDHPARGRVSADRRVAPSWVEVEPLSPAGVSVGHPVRGSGRSGT